MKRLVVDALGIDQPGGARTAVLDLYATFLARRPDWSVTFVLSAPEERLMGQNARQVVLPVRKGPVARALAVTLLPILAARAQADIVHCAKSQGAITPGVASVLTLFDATTLRYPDLHRPLAVWTWRHLQPRIARRADAIVTLSNDAANDLAHYLGAPREKIAVIPCAPQFGIARPTPDQVAAVRARHALPDSYLLFVGIIAKKKNLDVAFAALERLRARGRPTPPLICVGPRYALSDGGALLDTLARRGRGDIARYLGPVGVSDLAALFGGATLAVVPSVHEGFGITALEAMACGAPVVASRAASLPEVVGQAGLLVDDYRSPDAWADRIARLLDDAPLRARLIAAGLERAAQFSWDAAADQLGALFDQVASPAPVRSEAR